MKIYICERTLHSFFTAVYYGFNEQCVITSENNVQLPLGSQTVSVKAESDKAALVRKRICSYDKSAVNDVVNVLRSCDPKKEQVAFEYVRRLVAEKTPVLNAFNFPEVVAFNNILYKINGEVHRIKGLLRFMESAGGAFYAPYSPDNDITELLMPHFAARYGSERFVIHDVKRKIAGIYNGRECILGHMEETEIYISENQTAFERLWKKYYAAVNIKERPHEKQMRGSMPVRYWKFLPEKN